MRRLLLLLVACLALVGCRNERLAPVYTDRQRLMLDTTDNHTTNTDSLLAFVRHYQRTGDRQREMAALAELGHSYQTASRYTEAIKTHRQQLDLARQLGDTLMMATALNDLGVNFRRMGLYYDGLSHHTQAIDMAHGGHGGLREKLLKCRAIGYNGVGNVFLAIGQYQAADSTLRQALAIETRLGSHLGMNVDYSNLGMVFERRGLIDSALYYFRKAYFHSQQANSTTGLAYSHMNFGRLYQHRGQYDRAVIEFQLAMDVVPQDRDLWLWLQPCIAMAGVQVKMGKHAKALRYLDWAHATARQVGAREYYAQIYRLYADYYRGLGDYRRALEASDQATAAADSLLNLNNLFEIEGLQNEMAQQKAHEQMMQVRNHLARERQTSRLFGLALAGAVGLAIIFWYIAHLRMQNYRLQRSFMQARQRFFTNITHEFRTPLTIILGLGEELLASADSKRQQETGTLIVRQGRQLLSLVNQLLDISKVRSAIGEPDWHTGNVVPYLHMVSEGAQQLAKGKGVSLLFVPKEMEIIIDTVPDYLCKILRNLIGNAIKFTPSGGTVTLRCERRSDSLRLSVEDTGVGIAKEHLPHLFEPFFQVEGDSSNLGTGVGLSLVHQLVEAMHGEVRVESQVGKGTTFTVRFPLRQGEGRWKPFDMETITKVDFASLSPVLPVVADADGSPAPVPGQRARILIVEDNADVARYIGACLPENYSLIYASNGAEGLEKTLSLQPDLVISDLMMPVMDGLEMCRLIRADRTAGTTPVIVISAKATQDDLEAGLRAGANAYLFKPFSASELRIRVEWILAERRMLREKWQLAAQEVSEAGTKLSQEDKDFVSLFTHTIYDQLRTTEINLDGLADRLCMSRRTLQRRVNTLTGLSLTGYITKIRTDHARQLIRCRPELPIGEVAVMCGFSDRSYFDRTFKQSFGVTPAQYQRNVEI